MKKKDLIVIIIFIMFLTIPNILYWFIRDKMDNNNYENRQLYTKPELTFQNILDYPKNYDNYYNDNLAFKNEIRKIRSRIMYNLFNVSSNSRVIVGKDGWLFYNSIASEGVDTISDYRNISEYTDKQKEKIKESLLYVKNQLKEKNIKFYVLVIPNKENIYSDKLNKIIKKSNNKYSKTEKLVDYLNKNTDLNVIYPKEELIKNRKKYDTYYKYDTHWNDYGAYLGVKSLIKNIDNEIDIPKIKVSYEKRTGDLADMNLLSFLKNDEPKINNFYDDINYKCEEGQELKICESDNPIYDETLLFVGDSFRTATIQYLAKLYKNSIFIHKGYYNEDYIKKYNVNIVVYEAVERYSNTLESSNVILMD